MGAERRVVYTDSSALVKLVVEEHESLALERHLEGALTLVTSRIALVEVPRATALANPSAEVQEEVGQLLASCMLVNVSDRLLRTATGLTSRAVRTLDAIHLASALRIDPDEFIAYDRRLVTAAAERGITVSNPGVSR